MNHEPINHLPLRDEVSGIANLDAQGRRQRVRDNHNWFEGFCDGLFWGIAASALIVLVFSAIKFSTH